MYFRVLLLLGGLLAIPSIAQDNEPVSFPVTEQCRSVFPEISQLRRQMLEGIERKRFDDALKISLQMTALGDANCRSEKDRRLALQLNTAQIEIYRRKPKEAQRIYSENLDLAEEVYGTNSSNLQRYIADLLKLSASTVGLKEYEKIALRSLENKKARYGSHSTEYASELLRMGRFYEAAKRFEDAEKVYETAVEVADLFPLEKAQEKEITVNRYRSFILRRFGDEVGLQKDSELMRTRYSDFPVRDGVMNGLAFSLPRPSYPEQARINGVQGSVRVKIEIDERGFVTSAGAVDGHPLLRVNAEQAAKKARFLPTYFKGNPVRVSGFVIYNFNFYS